MFELNLRKGRRARDDGIARTSSTNSGWLMLAMAMLPAMGREQATATGEQIRVWLLAHGLPAPKTPHAWGAVTRHAARCGLITDTGISAQMREVRSHARRTPVWRLKGNA